MANKIKSVFVEEIKELLRSAKERVITAINIAMVYTNYEIGRRIVEEEQNGKKRAEYGKEIINQLSNELTKEFGKGYSRPYLRMIRQFYIVYSQDKICETVFSESQHHPITKEGRSFYLSWGHYIRLMRISNIDERHFYEIESYTNKWSVRERIKEIVRR